MTLSIDPTLARPVEAAVRPITYDDIRDALRAGVDDFMAMPTHVIFLVLIYPIVGVLIARVTMDGDLLPLAFPLTAGFALLGPFAALGMYELSSRRERGLPLDWRHAFDALRSPAWTSIAAVGCVLLIVFSAWIATARLLYAALAGDLHPGSIGQLVRFALTTPAGWALLVLGNGLGFLFAALALTIGVVSLPLLLDRGGSAVAAMRTSLRAVQASPAPMAAWGAIVAGALVAGCLPVFIGLALVLPVLGHATWHLYRRAVPPA